MCRSGDWSRQVKIERERTGSTIEKLQKQVRRNSKGHRVGARRQERGAVVTWFVLEMGAMVVE